MASSPVYIGTPKVTPQSWTNSDAANTKKTLATAGASGAKVVGVIATSTDGTARVFKLHLNRSATDYCLGAQTIAITAGTDGTTAGTNLLALMAGLPIDNDGQRYFFLESGDLLKGENITQVTSAKEVDIAVIFGNL